jgi:hypothetical protein
MSGATTTPASKPSRAGGLLSLVRKLVSYGTFLAATLSQHGLGNHPPSKAACSAPPTSR